MHAGDRSAWLLLVDDDESARFALPRALLRGAPPGFLIDVVTASTPAEARAALDARCDGPLLIVSDYDLKADATGIELLAEMQERCPGARRVLYSGHPRHLLEPLLKHAPVDAFIEKPDHFAELVGPLLAHLHVVSRSLEA